MTETTETDPNTVKINANVETTVIMGLKKICNLVAHLIRIKFALIVY